MKICKPLVLATSLMVAATPMAGAAETKEAKTWSESVNVKTIGGPVTPVKINVDLRDLPAPERWYKGKPIKEVPRRYYPAYKPAEGQERFYSQDPLVDMQSNAATQNHRAFGTPVINQDGLDFSSVNPPDPVLDVGKTYAIQSINGSGGTEVSVLLKSDGTEVANFIMDSLAPNGDPCAGGDGDPIILYDQVAERWFLQEFDTGTNALCFYISQTDDPVSGGWNFYSFQDVAFPDYPHFGIWPDAYYGTANQNSSVYAFDRVNMLAGNTARAALVYNLSSLDGYGFQLATPADWDGLELPPAGAPGIIMRHIDDEAHSNQECDAQGDPDTDCLQMYEFTVDFDTPANASLTLADTINITDFNSYLLDYTTFATVPQPGSGSRLDAIREVILNRLQYRNFGTHEVLVGLIPTNIDPATSGSTVQAGLRWFELRRTGGLNGSWTVFQEGTYADSSAVTENRLVGSISMDLSGNMAMAYTKTDTDSNNPLSASIAYTGRLSSDPLNVMTQNEVILNPGSGANTSGRWGDYAAMGVDPIDECTFWFTGEYQVGTQWATRIGAFAFEQCGCELTLDVLVADANAVSDNTIQVSWNDSSEATISEYRVFRSTTPGGSYELIATVNDTSPGNGSGAAYTYDDTTVSGGTTYYYIVRSSDGGSCSSDPSNEVSATATGVCTLEPQFSGVSSATNASEMMCQIDVAWNAATSQCQNGSIEYDVFRSDTSGFTPGPGNLIATGLTGTSLSDNSMDLMDRTNAYYIVRALDVSNGMSENNTTEAMGSPTGPVQAGNNIDDNVDSYADIAAAIAAGWSTAAIAGSDDWSVVSGDDNTTGSASSFVSTDIGSVSDKYLATEEFVPANDTSLSFYHKYEFESGFDGAVLEITVDGGANWSDLSSQFTQGSYDQALSTSWGHPFGGRQAWTGDQTTFTQVTVDLSSFAGNSVKVRWRLGTDVSIGAGDWLIDDISVNNIGVAGVCGIDDDLIFMNGFEQVAP
ncbi:fibronectin type III domain-containing protein [Marinicella rhabdoformis]|uniref:fibronectin type III domain-containing protein n=1 Tax=Marinicella rhabdoformis TaxID=2580566 RepID=UPI0012AEBC7E|nr:hypothetical protein [Marinicella rhabdoformis]